MKCLKKQEWNLDSNFWKVRIRGLRLLGECGFEGKHLAGVDAGDVGCGEGGVGFGDGVGEVDRAGGVFDDDGFEA